jgi:DNA-directed RNA polymerase subunit L
LSERSATEIKIRIYDRALVEKLDEYCRNNNYSSRNECVQSIITMFISGVDSTSGISELKGGKLITFFGKGKCTRCNKDLKTGDKVYWYFVKYADGRSQTVYLCYECYIQTSDQTLARLVLQREKLKREVNALRKELERLVAVVEQLEAFESLTQIYLNFRNTLEATHYTRIQSSDELKKAFSQLVEKMEDLARKFDETTAISKAIWKKLKRIIETKSAGELEVSTRTAR